LTPTPGVCRAEARPLRLRHRFVRADVGYGWYKAPPPAGAWIRRTCIRQPQLAGVETFGQIEQRSARAATWLDDQGSLLGNGSLRGVVIERNHRHDRRAKVPLHLGARMVVARVMAVQDQGHHLPLDAQLTFELIERGARMPQSNQV
jgi:hypothetical protein